MSDDHVAIARRVTAAWSDDDLEAAIELVHPDVELDFRGELVFPGLDDFYRGHEGFRKWWRDSREPWEFWRSEPLRFIAEGDKVVAAVHFEAKGKGSGVEVGLDFANFWTFRDGLVARFQGFETLEGALKASGLSDPS